jgi:broad specificity phosphatase PhoE
MAQQVILIRHGQTEWSRTGRHTGRTDVPLTAEGEREAEALGLALRGRDLSVWTSPLQRARETCRLAGWGDSSRVDDDLREWDYGVYEGRTTLEIRRETPEWSVWTSPIVKGESIDQVARRAKSAIARATEAGDRDVAIFSHGHMLRILAACWIGLPPGTGRFLALDTASVSVLGYERQTRVIRKWNLTAREPFE